MDSEITWAAMQKLLGVNKVTLSALAKQDIAVRGEKRGSYRLETVTQSIEHLRSVASGRGGEAGASAWERLGQAQATLAEVKARKLAGELVEVEAVEKLWTSKMRAFRNRICPRQPAPPSSG